MIFFITKGRVLKDFNNKLEGFKGYEWVGFKEILTIDRDFNKIWERLEGF